MLGAITRFAAVHANGKAFISNLNRRDLEPVAQLFKNTIKQIEEMKVGQSVYLLSPFRRDFKEFLQVFEKGAERADSILLSSKSSQDALNLKEIIKTHHEQAEKFGMIPSSLLQQRADALYKDYDRESTENLEKINTALTQALSRFSLSVLFAELSIAKELQQGVREGDRSICLKTQQARDWVDQTLNAVSKVVDEDNQKTKVFLEEVKMEEEFLRKFNL